MSILGLGCLAVTEGAQQRSNVIGVVDEREILAMEVSHRGNHLHKRLDLLMSPATKRFDLTDAFERADKCLTRMVGADVGYTVVRNSRGELVGLLDINDLFEAVRHKYDLEIDQLTTAAVDRRYGLM